jgi:putative heme-binding domain-containing protein
MEIARGEEAGMQGWVLAVALGLLQAPDVETGRRLYESQCALCHGQNGGGGRGPSLTRSKLMKAPDNASLERVISSGIRPEMPGAWQLSPREVKHVAAFVRSLGQVAPERVDGDAVRGGEVYKAQGCATCHMIKGEGSGRGPELTDIGARRSAAYLRESLVKPEASVPDRYMMVDVVSANGARVAGERVNEDTFTIQAIAAGGRLHSFRKADLKELKKTPNRSGMPSYASLSARDLQDLVAYLTGLRGEQ